MEVKRKLWVKAIAVFLSTLMVLQILPLTVLANEKVNEESLAPSLEETIVADIDHEIEEERKECSKTYLLEDGTYATYISSAALHTENPDGSWEDVADFETPNTIDELKKEVNEKAALFSAESSDSENSVVADYSDMEFRTIGTGISGVDEEELRIQQYDADGTSQIYSLGYVKLNNLNLPDLGDACIITKATLSAFASKLDGSENNIVTASLVENSWPESNTTVHPVAEEVMDYNDISSSEEEYYEWDITEAACQWSNGKENNGVALVPYQNKCQISAYIDSIVLYYSVIDELDNDFSFHSVDMGRAGTAYVNDYTNDFYLVRDELSIDGNIMPVGVTRTYNNSDNDRLTTAGSGWHWNYLSTLTRIRQSRVYFYQWSKEDGSVIYFEATSDSKVWKEKGVENGYTLTVGNLYNTIESKDDEYTYQYGSSSHRLENIVGKNDKTIHFDYDSSYGLCKITDGAGRQFSFADGTLNSNKYINTLSVLNEFGEAITLDDSDIYLEYEYGYKNSDNNRSLSSVTYRDSKSVNYTYDTNGNMTAIENADGTKLCVEYNENGKVVSYVKYASNGITVLDSLSINADEAYQRIFTDKNGNITRQQYDTKLNMISEITGDDGYFNEFDESGELKSLSVTEKHNNLIINSDFSDGLTGWTTTNNRGMKVVSDDKPGFKSGKYDNNVLEVPGISNAINYAKQTYLFNDEKNHEGEIYTVGVWAKVNGSISRTDEFNDNKSRTIGVLVNAYVNNDSGENTEQLLTQITFDNSISDWQYMMVSFEIPKNVDGIQVALTYNYQIGKVLFDGVTLYKSNLSSIIHLELSNGCICEKCTEPNCPCKCLNENDCSCKYCKRGITTTENEYGSILTETITDADTSMKKSYGYSNTNNYLANSTGENGVVTHYVYDENTGKLVSMATGNETDKINYTYNAVGLLKTVSQTVTNIITGEKVTMLSEYTYDGDALTQINHNGTIYSFEYDSAGNVSNVSVDTISLADYSYNQSNELNYLVYGNGDRINYTYDDKGNITSISTQHHEDETDSIIEYEYTYNDNDKLASYTDNVNGTVTTYTDSGYTITIPSADENTEDTVIYSTVTTDDTNESTINLFGYEFDTKKYANAYDIETGQTTASTQYTLPCRALGITGIGDSITVTDYYGRDISSTFKLHTDDIIEGDTEHINQYDYSINNSYTYVTDKNKVTTNLVSSYTSEIKLHYSLNAEEQAEINAAIENGEITQEELDELYAELDKTIRSLTTSYEYDNAGRITKICRNGEPLALYKYDEAGQLTEEINYEFEFICRYTYDGGGNITSKVYYGDAEYDEENDEFIYGEPTETINYSYESETPWGDLLTNYNGVDIIYDEMGNPLNYQGINYIKETVDLKFEWDGRLLKTVTYPDDGDTPGQKYEYSYNADGLRTQKDRYLWDNNTSDYRLYQTTEYIWNGNVLEGYRLSYRSLDKDNDDITIIYIVLPLYDENQKMIGVAMKNFGQDYTSNAENGENVYYFEKDAQGNIISMFDPLNNNYSVEYYYTGYGMTQLSIPKEEARINSMPTGTFGESLAKALAAIGLAALYSVYKELNPFMYRGYMYDGETGLYYNQSRYYSGEWGRFINADNPILMNKASQTINGSNVFAYCENDPINYIDSTGYWAEKYSGFKWTSKGFNLNVNCDFLSKSFCLLYTADIPRLKKQIKES